MDADQASHTQPEQMIELLFPELLPPTSLLSVTNKQIPHLPSSRTKGLNLGAPRDGAALESEERKKKQENDQSTRAVKRPLDQFCLFVCLFLLGAEPGWAMKICVCVCVCLNTLGSTGELGVVPGARGLRRPFRELACLPPWAGKLLEIRARPA